MYYQDMVGVLHLKLLRAAGQLKSICVWGGGMLGMELRASRMVCKCSTTKQQPQSNHRSFISLSSSRHLSIRNYQYDFPDLSLEFLWPEVDWFITLSLEHLSLTGMLRRQGCLLYPSPPPPNSHGQLCT